jgi:peptidoglycan/xylan/chitin deacetylase (PgdA/CDA1 family)
MKQITLMYHDIISDQTEKSGFRDIGSYTYKIATSDFESQVKIIAECFLKSPNYKYQIQLTFDDGGISFYKTIAPILEKYNLKGCFFIPTAYIGQPGFLTEKQIVELDQRGHSIGTHSHTHPMKISALPPESLENEWLESIRILKEILPVNHITSASIPGGNFSSQSRDVLFKNGIKYIFTSKPGFKIVNFGENQFIIGRFAIKSGMSINQLINILNNKSSRVAILMIKWKLLGILKNILGTNYEYIFELILHVFGRGKSSGKHT